jgi:hypothetical protein
MLRRVQATKHLPVFVVYTMHVFNKNCETIFIINFI